jgi:hypothetical protein
MDSLHEESLYKDSSNVPRLTRWLPQCLLTAQAGRISRRTNHPDLRWGLTSSPRVVDAYELQEGEPLSLHFSIRGSLVSPAVDARIVVVPHRIHPDLRRDPSQHQCVAT